MKSEDTKDIAKNFAKAWRNYVNRLLEYNEELRKIKIETEQGGITDKIPNAFTEPMAPKLKPPYATRTTDYSSKTVSERLSKEMDNINHPTHYNQGGIETLDYIKAKAPHYESYAIGNIIKYVSRYQHKNGLEDLKKAQFYLNDLIEWMESD
ncbi:DUF3310 domain-containing protein [Listeria monocytogenes]|nr:DUF3310 domain-containing protein [Listeria monocytogenes]